MHPGPVRLDQAADHRLLLHRRSRIHILELFILLHLDHLHQPLLALQDAPHCIGSEEHPC